MAGHSKLAELDSNGIVPGYYKQRKVIFDMLCEARIPEEELADHFEVIARELDFSGYDEDCDDDGTSSDDVVADGWFWWKAP